MGAKTELVLIDTNIFVIDLRYKRDAHYEKNLQFLTFIAENGTGFTTTVNLLELCGILSFNLNEKQLIELWVYFQDKYKVNVVPTAALDSNIPAIAIKEIFELLRKRIPFGDALVITLAKRYLPFIRTMVTWDKEHFEGKFPGTVLTPQQFLT